ncbi:uncharacterized protein MELLADRAFT_55451 [Melampsora larici-populina 98AG31]|uniref:Uncharacterized protein n=1 Tax=Melampsora larici-populina (strain 98AG31 / pathotype 3-4-7) TaxID=747676 RepID=F4RET2_MELLP|nr:uncharacterized protein MELLADRAFT_55451 [Melampsora larici-populina 98AG31]EGG09225.1 hypothetical protein MELLADRAFT_55451 [Melampsora larici-populina 98AG31]
MIVEDQAQEPRGANDVDIFDPPVPPPPRLPQPAATFECFMQGRAFRAKANHVSLRDNLVHHIWGKFGPQED